MVEDLPSNTRPQVKTPAQPKTQNQCNSYSYGFIWTSWFNQTEKTVRHISVFGLEWATHRTAALVHLCDACDHQVVLWCAAPVSSPSLTQ
jgi:hypothetical protein